MKEIRKEVIVDAPVSKVWEYLTDSTKLASWLMENDLEPKVGRKFTFRCEVPDEDDWDGMVYCKVKEIIPKEKLVLSWNSDQLEQATSVTITLEPIGEKTRVRLIHSGWDKLPPDKDFLFDNYDGGWTDYIEKKLKEVLN